MRTVLKYLFFLVLPVTLIIMWLAGVFHEKIHAKEVERPAREVTGVKTAPVKAVTEVKVPFSATVTASDRAEVSTRVMGYVVKELVKEGQLVKKGQTLYVIDPRDVKAQTEISRQRIEQARKNYLAAKAGYEAAKKTYERFKKLLKEGAVTQHEFDMVEAQFKAAEARLKAAEAEIKVAQEAYKAATAQLSYVEIKAPFTGYVVQKFADKGDIAAPGHPLLVLEKRPYKVEVSLPEKYQKKVKLGDELEVFVEALKKSFKAKVTELEPAVDPYTRTFKVKALIEGEGLKSGLYAKVYLVEKLDKPTVLVPKSAVYRRWDFTGVFVVLPEGIIELRMVRLGREFDGYYEVLSGVEPGEVIIVEGVERACDGCRIGG
ncbi:MAG: efflux RND transporter periplasmic adaptor subunit [Aquificae bacterium]|nr:efflux RND transporter periplasmic adaptor subunit [Aquificota bacterium]